ncbi:hypothetical protein FB107DRAFT_274791 [Schizophyllum commune]
MSQLELTASKETTQPIVPTSLPSVDSAPRDTPACFSGKEYDCDTPPGSLRASRTSSWRDSVRVTVPAKATDMSKTIPDSDIDDLAPTSSSATFSIGDDKQDGVSDNKHDDDHVEENASAQQSATDGDLPSTCNQNANGAPKNEPVVQANSLPTSEPKQYYEIYPSTVDEPGDKPANLCAKIAKSSPPSFVKRTSNHQRIPSVKRSLTDNRTPNVK